MSQVPSQFRTPVISVLEDMHMKNRLKARLSPLINKDWTRRVTSQLAKREGNRFKIELPSYLRATPGMKLKTQSVIKRWSEIQSNGHWHVGVTNKALDFQHEITPEKFKGWMGDMSSEAILDRLEETYAQEVVNFHYGVQTNTSDFRQAVERAVRYIVAQMVVGKNDLVGLFSDGMFSAVDSYMIQTVTGDNRTDIKNGIDDMFTWNGIKIMRDNNRIPPYLTGDRAGLCPTIFGACQVGKCIRMSFGVAGANRLVIRRGEIIEIEGVEGLVEGREQPLGFRQQFIVEADVYADSNGIADVRIWPHLRPKQKTIINYNHVGQPLHSDAFANVVCPPADGARVSFLGEPNSAHEQGVIFSPKAMVSITPPPAALPGCFPTQIMRTDRVTGLTIVFSMDGDITHNACSARFDASFDYIAFQRELGCRLIGRRIGDARDCVC